MRGRLADPGFHRPGVAFVRQEVERSATATRSLGWRIVMRKEVEKPSPSRSVPIAGLAVSVVGFVVCMGVVVEHLLTPDLIAAVVFFVVSLIPLSTGLLSRSYYRKLGGGARQQACPGA